MNNVIRVRKDFNGPLGEVTSIEGEAAQELIRLITVRAALRFYISTGVKVSPHFSMKLVKSTTKMGTNDKQAHMTKLDEMIEAQRALVTYHEETK